MADANISHENTDAHHVLQHGTGSEAGVVDHAKLNREHFDKRANTFDDFPRVKEVCARVGQEFVNGYPFDKEKTDVLDFACGTGESFCAGRCSSSSSDQLCLYS